MNVLRLKTATIAFLFTIIVCMVTVPVHALTYGEISYYGSSTSIPANVVSAATYTVNLLDSDNYLSYVYANFYLIDNNVAVKCVVYDENLSVVDESPTLATSNGVNTWYVWNFTSLNIILETGKNVTFGFVGNGTFYHHLSEFFAPYYGLRDTSNSYETPESLVASTAIQRPACYYQTFNGTAVPTPQPTTTSAPIGTNDFYANLIWYFVGLLLILAPAGVLGLWLKFGVYGFVGGLAAGAAITYIIDQLYLTTVELIPTWLIFLIIFGVVGMVWKGRGESI